MADPLPDGAWKTPEGRIRRMIRLKCLTEDRLVWGYMINGELTTIEMKRRPQGNLTALIEVDESDVVETDFEIH